MAWVPIEALPEEVSERDAVRLCYDAQIASTVSALSAGQSVLVECEKLAATEFLRAVRRVLSNRGGPRLFIADPRRGGGGGAGRAPANQPARGVMGAVAALRATVEELSRLLDSGEVVDSVVAIPQFDLMVSADQSGQHLDAMTRDVIILLYEYPDVTFLAFRDPALHLSKPLLDFFPKRIEVAGIERRFLPQVVTRAEARRLHPTHFDAYALYKYVSGLNAVRLRRVLAGLRSDRFVDGDAQAVYRELRAATMGIVGAELPDVRFDRDVAGYSQVVDFLRREVLGLMRRLADGAAEMQAEEIEAVERLLPRHLLFVGPPGTGKTLLCKALATELDATVIVVNGPELKSKWVGESEERIRRIFARARQCAPSIVVFDEIDSFGRSRAGGGADRAGATVVEHSMLNQLLTEMDGFRSEETVFVVGTTNFAESLDEALRSRFDLVVEVPYPDRQDRGAILDVYDAKYGLGLSAGVREAIVEATEQWVDPDAWRRFAGRDLQRVAATLARRRFIEAAHSGVDVTSIPITETMAREAVEELIARKLVPLTFDDIGGYDDVKQRLRQDILELLRQALALAPGERERLARAIPRGVIFEGPPGTGKTMFARALATHLGAAVSVVRGPELKEAAYGASEARVRELFAAARRNAPTVLVFDEIDAIASSRATGGSVDRSLVNQLLTEMDGLGARELVFVVATTNFADSLDQALRRPGRFEFVFHIGYPDAAARRAIFELYAGRYELQLDAAALDYLVDRTDGWVDLQAGTRFSGDHIEAICRALYRRRLRSGGAPLTRADLDAALRQRTGKPERLTPKEREVVAAHEAGHAIVALHTPGAQPVRRVTIESEYDGSLGYVLHGPRAERHITDERTLYAQLACLMGGREGERLAFGRIASGGAEDLHKATVLATHLVAAFGMDDEIGPRMVLHPLVHGEGVGGTTPPALLERVEERVGILLRRAAESARKTLEAHAEEFDALRRRLFESGTVEFTRTDESSTPAAPLGDEDTPA